MKVLCLIVLFLKFCEFKFDVIVRFRTFNCFSSGKTIDFISCYIKSFDRGRISTINAIFNKTRKVGDDFLVDIVFYKARDQGGGEIVYDELFKLEKIEFCKVLDKTNKRNEDVLLKNALKISSLSFLTQICDKNGQFKAMNYTFANWPQIL